MVCQNCEKKIKNLVTPDMWKAGSSASGAPRPPVQNKALASMPKSFVQLDRRCKLCSDRLIQKDFNYCQKCAYKQGICGICGVKLHNTTLYRQSEV